MLILIVSALQMRMDREIDYRMQYKGVRGESFDWLYIDFDTLCMYAEQCGLLCEKVADGEHYDYLARLTVK